MSITSQSRMFLTAIAVAVSAIAGCGSANAPTAAVASPVGNDRYEVTLLDTVYLVTLKDGTRCAVYSGYKAGGISCNWARAGVER